MNLSELKDKANSLPTKPGVYLMMDASGRVIYVGKAKALKNRVSQYFQDSAGHSFKTASMVSQVKEFDVILAGTEFEALVLECSLIKRHMPKYNILLKDDKGYPYIRLGANEDYPRFSLVAKPAADGARYFGPYGGRNETHAVIDAIRVALKLPNCNRKFPRDIGRERPCLNRHMGICDGYCLPPGEPGRYRAAVEQAVLILEGKFDEVRGRLAAEMEQAAEELRFERAAELRDRLRAIETLGKQQHVVAGTRADTDVIGFFRGEAKSCLAVLCYVDGDLIRKDVELFDTPVEEEPGELLSAAVSLYYLGQNRTPREILLPVRMEDEALIERMLRERAGRKISLLVPERGAKKTLVSLAQQNASEEAERATSGEERTGRLLLTLQKMLDLERPPMRMEAYDISHTAGEEIVASMAVFTDARPLKRDYRRFKIKTLQGQDDYRAMEEVLMRRILRLQGGDEAFGAAPDLLLIDGGAAHANVAGRVLEKAGLHIPVYGMVKDDRHRTRALVTREGREIGISGNPAVYALIGRIQEEAHRFAVEYHRQRRSKGGRRSELDSIPGVGEKRKAVLLKQFKSIKAIRQADTDTLASAVPKDVALLVYGHFHPEGREQDEPVAD